MKTIKQIADEIGVSKQAVRDKIAKLGLQSTLQKNGNTLVIDEQQESLIKKNFENETQSTLQSESQSDFYFALRLLEKQNEQLSRELNIKNEQINNLNERLAEMTQLASNAQRLHAGTIHNSQKQLTGFSLDDNISVSEEPPVSESEEKQSFNFFVWLGRFFK